MSNANRKRQKDEAYATELLAWAIGLEARKATGKKLGLAKHAIERAMNDESGRAEMGSHSGHRHMKTLARISNIDYRHERRVASLLSGLGYERRGP